MSVGGTPNYIDQIADKEDQSSDDKHQLPLITFVLKNTSVFHENSDYLLIQKEIKLTLSLTIMPTSRGEKIGIALARVLEMPIKMPA